MRTYRAGLFSALLGVGALALGATPWPGVAAQAPHPVLRMIVHATNPHGRLQRDFVTAAFLRKTLLWSNGEAIRPVDQITDSAARRRFSHEVLRRSVAAVRSYWQQLIFSGRGLPPPELASDEEVIRFVALNRGGIGYVASTADLVGVKVVSLE